MTQITALEITAKQAPELLADVLDAGLVPLLVSSPGIGKSSIIKQVAVQRKLKVIDLRLAASDPTDMSGFPSVNADRSKAGYLPMDTFPVEGDEIPEGYDGWMLFLDEMTSAPMSVQAAAYKLVLDKMVGLKNLHPKVQIVAAGNKTTDKAIVTRTSTAMQSRLVTLTLGLDVEGWISHALTNDFDMRVVGWITQFPDKLHMFDPNHNDVTFPCPRTYEFLSDIIKPMTTIPDWKLPLVAGTVGKGVAIEFTNFINIFEKLPKIETILANPDTCQCYGHDEPNLNYAISATLVSHMNEDSAEAIITYMKRMPKQFEVIILKQSLKKNPAIKKMSFFMGWVKENAHLMMD